MTDERNYKVDVEVMEENEKYFMKIFGKDFELIPDMIDEQYLMRHFHYEPNPSKFNLVFSVRKENDHIEKITEVFLIYGHPTVPMKILKLNTEKFSSLLWDTIWELYYMNEGGER